MPEQDGARSGVKANRHMRPMSPPGCLHIRPIELGARWGMYRRAMAATHERHASVLAIHFTLRVSNESLFHQTEKADKKGIKRDVVRGAWTLPEWPLVLMAPFH
jgi:hypothetical protein